MIFSMKQTEVSAKELKKGIDKSPYYDFIKKKAIPFFFANKKKDVLVFHNGVLQEKSAYIYEIVKSLYPLGDEYYAHRINFHFSIDKTDTITIVH